MGLLHGLDLIAIAAYAIGMLLVGWWYGSRQRTTEEYFVGGRTVHPLVAGISLVATLLSTISYLTYPGELIANGPGLMWGLLHIPISYFVVGYLIMPHIMRQKVTSAYELLEARFGPGVRRTASAFFICVRLPWMAFIIFTCAYAVSTVTRIDMAWLLAIIGLVTTIYTVMGGIRAVIATDVIQFAILFGGGIITIAFVAARCGFAALWPDWTSPALADLHWEPLKVASFSPFQRVTVVTAVLTSAVWWICNAASDQVVIQRYLCTRDARAARKSFLHCVVGDFAISAVLWIVGIAVLSYFLRFRQQLPTADRSVVAQADRLFPHFIGTALPQGLSGLVIAALLAAAMSSLSSGISSIGTVLVTDFRDLFAAGVDTEAQLLTRAKRVSVVIGLVSMSLSYAIAFIPGRNLFEVGYRMSEFFTAPMCALFLMAFFVPFSNRAGAWAAIIVGFMSGVLFSYWRQIVGAFVPTQDYSIILILPSSIACSVTAGIVASGIGYVLRQSEPPELITIEDS